MSSQLEDMPVCGQTTGRGGISGLLRNSECEWVSVCDAHLWVFPETKETTGTEGLLDQNGHREDGGRGHVHRYFGARHSPWCIHHIVGFNLHNKTTP